jgi:large subunit ribosomal protein L20
MLHSARGYWGTRRKLKFNASITLLRAGQFAYRDRRTRRRNFRALWITRLNAACRMRGMQYSRFIGAIQRAGVLLNRKMLSLIAIEDPGAFDRLVALARASAGTTTTSATVTTTTTSPRAARDHAAV